MLSSNPFRLSVFVAALSSAALLGLRSRPIFGQPAGPARTPPAASVTTPETFVDALNYVFGKQSTQRATHAKGIVLTGKFVPDPHASDVSKAPHFSQAVPVTVRFSANTGIPQIPDADPHASPHGLAIKFHLQDGTETDLVTHSFNGFPAKDADEMRRFLIAVGSSRPGLPSPTPLDKFTAEHPAAKRFVTTQDPPPVSYATTTYFGVNSLKFTNVSGSATFARYQLIPEAGRHFLSKEQAAATSPNYLSDELRSRVARGHVRFKLVLQLAAPGDKIDDPSIAWSDKNDVKTLGTLEVAAVVPDSETTDRGLLFMPGVLPVGIEAADPMIAFRSKTYPVSYQRRQNP